MLRSSGSYRNLAMRRLLMLGFIIIAICTVVDPSLITRVALLLGVGRGADLLLYLLVVAFLGQMATTHRRIVSQERRLGKVARAIALETVLSPDNLPDAGSSESSFSSQE